MPTLVILFAGVSLVTLILWNKVDILTNTIRDFNDALNDIRNRMILQDQAIENIHALLDEKFEGWDPVSDKLMEEELAKSERELIERLENEK